MPKFHRRHFSAYPPRQTDDTCFLTTMKFLLTLCAALAVASPALAAATPDDPDAPFSAPGSATSDPLSAAGGASSGDAYRVWPAAGQTSTQTVSDLPKDLRLPGTGGDEKTANPLVPDGLYGPPRELHPQHPHKGIVDNMAHPLVTYPSKEAYEAAKGAYLANLAAKQLGDGTAKQPYTNTMEPFYPTVHQPQGTGLLPDNVLVKAQEAAYQRAAAANIKLTPEERQQAAQDAADAVASYWKDKQRTEKALRKELVKRYNRLVHHFKRNYAGDAEYKTALVDLTKKLSAALDIPSKHTKWSTK